MLRFDLLTQHLTIFCVKPPSSTRMGCCRQASGSGAFNVALDAPATYPKASGYRTFALPFLNMRFDDAFS